MTREAHRAALKATARVALCATAFACSPKTPPADKVPPGEAATQEATPTADPATTATTESPPPAEASEWTEAEIASCRDMTGKAWDAQGKRLDGSASDEDLKKCCLALSETVDPMKTSEWVERGECCKLIEWNGGAACTPWGPPVPPAMA